MFEFMITQMTKIQMQHCNKLECLWSAFIQLEQSSLLREKLLFPLPFSKYIFDHLRIS